MNYEKRLPCQLGIDFSDYDNLDADIKQALEVLRSGSITIISLSDSSKRDYRYRLESEYEKYINPSYCKMFYSMFYLNTEDIDSSDYNDLLEIYGEEFAQKIAACFNAKLTTIKSYIFIDYAEFVWVEKSGGTHPSPKINKGDLLEHFKNRNNESSVKSGSWVLVEGTRGLEVIPVTINFKVNGVKNTDETIEPIMLYDSTSHSNINFIDMMPSDNASDLPDHLHSNTFRDISKNYVVVPYNPKLIKYLMSIDSTALEAIYIENNHTHYASGIEDEYNDFEYVKLPKAAYVINSEGYIYDSDNPSKGLDFNRLNDVFDIYIWHKFFGSYGTDYSKTYYLGEVYAVLKQEKLGIETVTGNMKISANWPDGEKTVEDLEKLFVSPMHCNKFYEFSDKTNYIVPYNIYDMDDYFYPYLVWGSNGFAPAEDQLLSFTATINDVLYELYSSSAKCIIGLKMDGYPNNQYVLDPNSSGEELICGHKVDPDNPSSDVVETPQEVVAYVMNHIDFENAGGGGGNIGK